MKRLSVRGRKLETQVVGGMNWLISFGDLLTLLVCFFLIICQTGVGKTTENISLNQQVIDRSKKTALGQTLGTVLASVKSVPESERETDRPPLWQLPFYSQDFTGRTELSADAVARLAEELRSVSEDQPLQIAVCGDSNSGDWSVVEPRALGLWRLVAEERKLSKQQVRITLAASCQSIAEHVAGTDTVQAVVSAITPESELNLS